TSDTAGGGMECGSSSFSRGPKCRNTKRFEAMILAGDIGGTKCNIGLFRHDGAHLELLFKQRFSTREYAHRPFQQLLADFRQALAERNGDLARGEVTAAGFGGAGAVVNGVLLGTYVPWKLDAEVLADELGLKRISLLNDVEATALSVPNLRPQDLLSLNAHAATRNGTKALIAAGTGLGEAILFWDGKRYHAIPTEGGEADFT